jgi:predicted Fe-Mo cluster-binding NifX family protein
MRIIYPTNTNMGYLSPRGAHFGKANYYTIITLENEKIVDVEGVENPGHDAGGCGSAVSNIMSLNPDALVVSGIGSSPAKGFANAGLDVYHDTVSANVEESVKFFIEGKLKKVASGTCSVK